MNVFRGINYVHISNKGTVRIGKTIFQYLFNPIKYDRIGSLLITIDKNINVTEDNIVQTINSLHTKILLNKYSLSLLDPPKPTLKQIIRSQCLTESAITDKYVNLLYNYIISKTAQVETQTRNRIKVAIKTVTDNASRMEIVVKDTIIREISLLRSPPTNIWQGALKIA